MKPPPHHDFEPFELAENLEEDLGLFEAATHAPRITLEEPAPRAVLAITGWAGPTLPAETAIHACRGFARTVAGRLSAALFEEAGTRSAEEIEAAARGVGAGLVVVSAEAPFAGMLEQLSAQLAGTRSLAVLGGGRRARGRRLEPESLLESVVLPLFADGPAARRAAGWACGLVSEGGRLVALELGSQATRGAARGADRGAKGSSAVPDASVGRAVSARVGSLVAALQRRGSEEGFTVEVGFRAGPPVDEILALATIAARPATVVLGHAGGASDDAAVRLALRLVRQGGPAVVLA
jgi:hypothetical protein